jgi:hypothetical protein
VPFPAFWSVGFVLIHLIFALTRHSVSPSLSPFDSAVTSLPSFVEALQQLSVTRELLSRAWSIPAPALRKVIKTTGKRKDLRPCRTSIRNRLCQIMHPTIGLVLHRTALCRPMSLAAILVCLPIPEAEECSQNAADRRLVQQEWKI